MFCGQVFDLIKQGPQEPEILVSGREGRTTSSKVHENIKETKKKEKKKGER